MKISLEWLSDYVDLPANLEIRQIMHDLTMSTVEVEGAHN
jgi:phenylalanyl-tRNA synthetase beta chain